MLVRKTEPFPVECVVRGYMAGSGWKDYQRTGAVCGIALPKGLRESDRLEEPIFTPSTKAETGHDENISFEQMAGIVGAARAAELRDLTLELYRRARAHAEGCGILLADTKLEFGTSEGRVVWIDEAFTPDSSRFWPRDGYEPGRAQPSFDKQYVRDYLETLDWDKRPPGPPLTGRRGDPHPRKVPRSLRAPDRHIAHGARRVEPRTRRRAVRTITALVRSMAQTRRHRGTIGPPPSAVPAAG